MDSKQRQWLLLMADLYWGLTVRPLHWRVLTLSHLICWNTTYWISAFWKMRCRSPGEERNERQKEQLAEKNQNIHVFVHLFVSQIFWAWDTVLGSGIITGGKNHSWSKHVFQVIQQLLKQIVPRTPLSKGSVWEGCETWYGDGGGDWTRPGQWAVKLRFKGGRGESQTL